MQTFNLRDEWTSLETERALVAAVARNPALYWELIDTLPAGVFAFDETGEAWALLAEAIEAERKPTARLGIHRGSSGTVGDRPASGAGEQPEAEPAGVQTFSGRTRGGAYGGQI